MVTKQLEKIEKCQRLLKSVRNAKLDDSSPEKISVLEDATNLLTSINDFLRIGLGYLNAEVWKRLGRAIINDDKVTQSINEFNDALGDFGKSLMMAATMVTLLEDGVKSREKTLDFFSQMDFKVVQNEIRKMRTPGTGQWLFETDQFKKWWKEGASLLWCFGLGMSYTALH
jgi:hypothetical protein